MTKVTVIIPNLNGRDLLKGSLASLFKSSYSNFEVCLVDNGSSDDSVSFVQKFYPKVLIIKNKLNLGFAKAVNLAIAKTKSQYIVLLNNDTRVDRKWLEKLVEAAKNHPECASIASKVINLKKPNLIDGAGDKINIVGQAHPIGQGEPVERYNRGSYILGATGGASLFKRQAFDEIGLFDEDFFFYFEDVDWALRMQIYGFKSFFEPEAIVYHLGGETAKKLPRLMEYLRFRNTMLLVIKNFPWQLFLSRLRFIKIPLVFAHTFYFFLRKGLILEALAAVTYVFVHLPKFLGKRVKLQKKRQVSLKYFDLLMEGKSIKIGALRF